MDQGAIVEEGTHKELMKKKGKLSYGVYQVFRYTVLTKLHVV